MKCRAGRSSSGDLEIFDEVQVCEGEIFDEVRACEGQYDQQMLWLYLKRKGLDKVDVHFAFAEGD